jgi:hypothetical protein
MHDLALRGWAPHASRTVEDRVDDVAVPVDPTVMIIVS